MVAIAGFELNTLQLILIVALILTLIFGPIGMITAKKKKKKEEEMMMNAYNGGNESFNTDSISPEEAKARDYIMQYKSTYSRDSIKEALIQNGNSEQKVLEWLNKYF